MDKWQHKFEIKEGQWVYVPTKIMLEFGKRLHNKVREKWTSPLYFYHMRDGGHVAAARKHINSEYFALIDIKSFFESTSQSRVTRELKHIFPYKDARKIAKLSTVRNPMVHGTKFIIPYGYPQSPILATLCLHKSYCGGLFSSINKSGNVLLSVYMDDIIISGNDLNVVAATYTLLSEALKKSGYSMNSTKSQSPAKKIKVFNLELSHQSLRVSSQRIVEFLIAYAKSTDPNEMAGIAAYVSSVNAEQAKLFP
ncbi:TPA: reverse transcriptase domain-containing protein [Serratia liquefaciens]|jgi:hypothetical protein|uniref:reverse transcriptase domain-containing protein n=1 Tax=Serratia TaxID=613 RepID=UPI000744E5ED|nr:MULTISPECIES: reverse transcriptase domain-containing protein [Serratia]MDU4172454.1 reverse transcriptase domain-containing protein [Serratia liquefaciens]CVF69600.1 Retron-type reverse transcriptase [Serratia marcescens]